MKSRHTAFVVVSTTVDGISGAGRLAQIIVENRLAACVQYRPIRSVYRWKNKIESAEEYLLVAKTRASLANRLVKFIQSVHSYELPEVTVMPITAGLAKYLDWIYDETAGLPRHKQSRGKGRIGRTQRGRARV